MIKYDDLILIARENDWDEGDVNKIRAEFYDCDNEKCIYINNLEKMDPISLVYKNNVFDYLNKNTMSSILSKIEKILFISVNEIVFILEDEDLDYLEETYCIEINEEFLGCYNNEYSVIYINIKLLAEETLDMLMRGGNLSKENFEKVMTNEIILTLIHELGHSIVNCEYVEEKYKPKPFKLNVEDDEEKVVEEYSKNVLSTLNNDIGLLNEELFKKYL